MNVTSSEYITSPETTVQAALTPLLSSHLVKLVDTPADAVVAEQRGATTGIRETVRECVRACTRHNLREGLWSFIEHPGKERLYLRLGASSGRYGLLHASREP
jgi:hypothetical protein